MFLDTERHTALIQGKTNLYRTLHIVTQLVVNVSDTVNSGQLLALLLIQQSLLVTAVMLLRRTYAFSGCLESLSDCRCTCRTCRTHWENHQATGKSDSQELYEEPRESDFLWWGGT